MTKFCTITPDRGDRKPFMDFCEKQLKRQTVKPDASYFMDWPPADNRKDISARLLYGVAKARQDDYEKVFIVESDDFYRVDYFEQVLKLWAKTERPTIIGCSQTIYYNLKNNTYETYNHEFRSSLFCTAFDMSALKKFPWDQLEEQATFIDQTLWKWMTRHGQTILYDQPFAIGIKHNMGLTGGKAHKMILKNRDPNRTYLQSAVDKEAFEFYQSLSL